jgi:hypothetical protein
MLRSGLPDEASRPVRHSLPSYNDGAKSPVYNDGAKSGSPPAVGPLYPLRLCNSYVRAGPSGRKRCPRLMLTRTCGRRTATKGRPSSF